MFTCFCSPSELAIYDGWGEFNSESDSDILADYEEDSDADSEYY